MTLSAYQVSLDEIYRTFMRVKDRVKGRPDREVRNPTRLISLAHELDLVPPANQIIRVTGSKGKGTTSRLIARYLQAAYPDCKIALFVSPEEFEHRDRMSINGTPISENEFAAIFEELHPRLARLEIPFGENDYFSPFGLFLLVALVWFNRDRAQKYILESGRGVLADEVGLIPSIVSVVTSIFLEHAEALGPTIDEIAKDKLSIASTSSIVVLSESAKEYYTGSSIASSCEKIEVPSFKGSTDLPAWLTYDDKLARSAVEAFLRNGNTKLAQIDIRNVSASFGTGRRGEVSYAFEALINLDSMDRNMFSVWCDRYKHLAVVASFPDDKDRERLITHFQQHGAAVTEVALLGTRGYLNYRQARASAERIVEFDYLDDEGFLRWLDGYLELERPAFIYLSGTQTFIRLVKHALRGTTPA